MKKLLALLLTLTLLLPCALATEDKNPFPSIRTYPGFSDTTGRWSEPYVRTCYEVGLMEGTGTGFAPQAQLTQGEVAAIAARMGAAITGNAIPMATPKLGETLPWYFSYVEYLKGYGVTVEAPKANASRQMFFTLLSAVVPVERLKPINSISILPDTRDANILAFYNAGILTGVDAFGTFDGASPLTREECATMCARIVTPSLRRRFTPAGQVPAGAMDPQTVIATLNTTPVTYGEYEDLLLSLARELQAMYVENGLAFSWEGKHGEDWDTYFRSAILHSLTAKYVAHTKAQELGAPQEKLAITLFGPPSQEEILTYAKTHKVDLTQPGQKDVAAEMILEEKLNTQLSIWVEEVSVTYTSEYQKLDPVAICRERLGE